MVKFPRVYLMQNKALAYILKFCKYKLILSLLQTFADSHAVEDKKLLSFGAWSMASMLCPKHLFSTHHHLHRSFSC